MWKNPNSPVCSFTVHKKENKVLYLCTTQEELLQKGHVQSTSLIYINLDEDSPLLRPPLHLRLRILSSWFTGDVYFPEPTKDCKMIVDPYHWTVEIPVHHSDDHPSFLQDSSSLLVEFGSSRAFESFVELNKMCQFERFLSPPPVVEHKQEETMKLILEKEIRERLPTPIVNMLSCWEPLFHVPVYEFVCMVDLVTTKYQFLQKYEQEKTPEQCLEIAKQTAEKCYVVWRQ